MGALWPEKIKRFVAFNVGLTLLSLIVGDVAVFAVFFIVTKFLLLGKVFIYWIF